MRGLSFKISQPKGKPLQQILKCIHVEEYYWYVVNSQNDTWHGDMENLLFEHEFFDGISFWEVINQDHFVIFLKLQAYRCESEYIEMLSYEGFLNSDCQLLLLIHDCCFVDIYMKDQTVIETIYRYAVNSGFQDVHYISEENDTRTKMIVV